MTTGRSEPFCPDWLRAPYDVAMELDQPLPSQARFLQLRADQERERGVKWSADFPDYVRNRLSDAIATNIHGGVRAQISFIRESRRVLSSHSQYSNITLMSWDSYFTLLRKSEEVVDALDAAALSLARLARDLNGQLASGRQPYEYDPDAFISAANDILLEGRISFTFIGGRLRERGAEPLHSDVMRPLETMLTAEPRFAEAERAYQDALTAMATGHYGASITSSASALQQTLVALGSKGQNLGALFLDARRRGFLMSHDEKLMNAFRSIGDWVTADRSNRGNAHGASIALREDAELAIHVIAALIIRLIKSQRSEETD